jgi:ABC-type transport system substrate-binding protein
LLSLALLAGCGGAGAPSGSGTGGGSGGKTLTVATADDIQSVDPAKAYDTWSTAVVHAFTRRLVDYDAQGKLVADLAEKWDVSDGGKTYTFHLRPDAKFADGSPVEAAHFKRAVERVQDPTTASKGAGFYSGIRSLEAPDPHTLVVHLKAADPTLLNVMGMTFASPVQEGQDERKPAASGPYVLESYEKGSQAVLRRNPADAASASGADRIVVQLGVKEPLQLTRLRNGEVDLLPAIPPADYARVMNDPSERARVVQGVVNQTWYFGMNVTRPPWNNPKVRRAALLALNRERHVQLAGAGQLANGVLPPHVPGYNAARKIPAQDAAAAKRLLAEAGFPNGIPASRKTTLWLANNDQYVRHAEAIQSDLQAVGIPVELRPVVLSEYLKSYRTQADCWYGGWYPDFPDAGNFMEPVFHGRNVGPGNNNAAHYNNPRLNALLDRAHPMPQGPQREALYRQAEDILMEDLPWIPLYYEMETRYFGPGVTGVTVHPVWRQILTGIGKK